MMTNLHVNIILEYGLSAWHKIKFITAYVLNFLWFLVTFFLPHYLIYIRCGFDCMPLVNMPKHRILKYE